MAGTGFVGDSGDGGQATLATLKGPQGVCLDTNGDIFIADTANHKIRKVTVSTGVITTVAGNGDPLFDGDNGAATSASLNNPEDVAVDSVGNIFIADTGNGRIRKVTASTGKMTTIAGSGNENDALKVVTFEATKYYLFGPTGVALDTSGNVFIAGGSKDSCIFKLTASTGKISVVAGTGPYFSSTAEYYNGDDILATLAGIRDPTKVAVDASGNLLISDTGNNRIRKVTANTGLISTVAGSGYNTDFYDTGSKSATEVAIENPTGVVFDSVGNFYFCDSLTNLVRKVTYSGVTSPSASSSKAPTGVSAPATTPAAPTGVSAPTTKPAAPSTAGVPTAPSSAGVPTAPSSAGVSTAPSSAGVPTAPSSAGTTTAPSVKAPTTSSSTGSQSSATGHIAQALHMAMILLSSVLILHLCRDE